MKCQGHSQRPLPWVSPGSARDDWGTAAERGCGEPFFSFTSRPRRLSPHLQLLPSETSRTRSSLGSGRRDYRDRAIIYNTTCLNDCPKSLSD